MDKSDCMRTVRFTPYLKGQGPTFTLKLFYLGHKRIGYTLTRRWQNQTTVLFEGSDFRPSPMDAVDSDAAVKALMTFLTLRPGDTDPEYFANYTEAQTSFAQEHAETLSGEVFCRFGE